MGRGSKWKMCTCVIRQSDCYRKYTLAHIVIVWQMWYVRGSFGSCNKVLKMHLCMDISFFWILRLQMLWAGLWPRGMCPRQWTQRQVGGCSIQEEMGQDWNILVPISAQTQAPLQVVPISCFKIKVTCSLMKFKTHIQNASYTVYDDHVKTGDLHWQLWCIKKYGIAIGYYLLILYFMLILWHYKDF